MRLGVIGNVNPNTFCRAFVGTRAQITAANLANGTVTICTDEAENSIDLTVVYPVGSIYMNATDDTNPATLFGIGTWSLIDSKFLYGANSLLSDLGGTGGATTATLVQNNLPTSLTGLTISAMTGSTSTESTDHTHTVTIADSGTTSTISGTTENVKGSTTTWNHHHRARLNNHEETIDRVYPSNFYNGGVGGNSRWDNETRYFEYVGSNMDYLFIEDTDLQHKHDFNVDFDWTHSHTNTVSNQSEHATHSHTVGVDSQTINLTNVGSGTSFSILPSYRKVAIWFRQA